MEADALCLSWPEDMLPAKEKKKLCEIWKAHEQGLLARKQRNSQIVFCEAHQVFCMDSRVAAVLHPPVYEDFIPPSEFVQNKDCDTYHIHLPGFRKENLKILLTKSKTLRITGTRSIGNNKWSRFHEEFPVTAEHDIQKISAKFEGGILYVRLPKLVPPVLNKEEKEEPDLPASDITPTPEKPAAEPQNRVVQEPAAEKPAQKDDLTNAQNLKREKNEIPEKKAKTSPDEKASGGMDGRKEKSVAGGDKQEDDSTKRSPDEKTKGSNDSEKKSIAGDKRENDRAKDAEIKREKENTETEEERGKTGAPNKESAGDVASILKRHRRIFNLTLIVIFAVALGLHITNFLRTLKRTED